VESKGSKPGPHGVANTRWGLKAASVGVSGVSNSADRNCSDGSVAHID